MKKTIRVYVATPIRGEHGNAATFEQMQANAKIAEVGLKWLEKNFPWVEFFCPAVHDRIVQRLATKGYVTYEQILECDHEEQALCQVFLAFTWAPSSGVDQERVLAQKLRQPMVILHHPGDLEGNSVEYNRLFQLFAHHQLIDTFRQDEPTVTSGRAALLDAINSKDGRKIIDDYAQKAARVPLRVDRELVQPLTIRSVGLNGEIQDNAVRPRIGKDHDDDTSCIS